GAGETVEEPAASSKGVLHAVLVAYRGDTFAADHRRRVSDHVVEEGSDLPDRSANVPARVGEVAELARKSSERGVQIALLDGQALDQEQGVQHAVALGQVECEGVAAALLAAGHRATGVHEIGYVLEADGRLVEWHAQLLADAVDQERG